MLHPKSGCAALSSIEVEVTRPRPGQLMMRYAVAGTTGALHLPPVGAPGRADGLWRHTCFEAFVCAEAGDGYYEFNFAPSMQWAAYRFDAYRTGMSEVDGIIAPRIEAKSGNRTYELHATLELTGLVDLPVDAPWRLGLSAVVEEEGGSLSHWALAHPPGEPDFHHSDCFALQLAPALRP